MSWQSKLQPTVAVSTTEAEYIAAATVSKEAMWLRKLMVDFGMRLACLEIGGDNQSALGLVKNPINSYRSKHIAVQFHFVRERAARGEVKFSYVPTNLMVADALTKPVPEPKLRYCREKMGVR